MGLSFKRPVTGARVSESLLIRCADSRGVGKPLGMLIYCFTACKLRFLMTFAWRSSGFRSNQGFLRNYAGAAPGEPIDHQPIVARS